MGKRFKRLLAFFMAGILSMDSGYGLLYARAGEVTQISASDNFKLPSYNEELAELQIVDMDISMDDETWEELKEPEYVTSIQENEASEIDYILGRPMTKEEEDREKEEMRRYTSNLVPLDPGRVAPRLQKSKEVIVRNTQLPASYDSRNENIVTSIKNQTPHGICWSFSSTAMAEISMIKQGFASLDDTDFSEYHLAYYTYRFVEDPLGGTRGDTNYKSSINNILQDGSNFSSASNTLTTWMGIAAEEAAPFPAHNNPQPLAETPEHAYGQNEGIIKNVMEINMDDRNAVKKAIMDYGAVGLMYYAAENSDYYNYSTAAQYINQEVGVNHAVVIIGWNDNYSKSNFSIQPASNGAWLIRNSWGTGFGNDGYFWLSYEDQSIFDTVYAFQMTGTDTYDHNYQYDGSLLDAAFGYAYTINGQSVPVTTYTGANIFQVKGNGETGQKEALKAVSFKTFDTNIDYEIQIYKNPVPPTIEGGVINPESGEALLTNPITGTTTHAGYYTIDINEDIILNQGDYFAVAITYTNNNGPVRIIIETSSSGETQVSTAACEVGQSVHKVGNSWYDNVKGGYKNLRIKAFTTDVSEEDVVSVSGIKLNQNSGKLKTGEEIQLTYEILPQDATDKEVTWESSNPTVAEVSNRGLITAKGQGTSNITVITKDGGFTDTCEVVVDNLPTISAVNVSDISDQSALVTIEANDGTDGSINTYELSFETNMAGATITQKTDKKQFQISGLTPQTTYKVIAKVTDNSGSSAIYEKTFMTLIHQHTWDSKWSDNEKFHWHACISTDGMTCGVTDISKAAGYGEHRRGGIQGYKEPTAEEFGYTGDVYCIDCERLLEEGKTIDKIIPVTNINIIEASGKLGTGDSLQLIYGIVPSNATNQRVTWKSSNISVAMVDGNGLVTAHTQGEAIITVTTEDGSHSDTYRLVVDNPPTITSVSVSSIKDSTAVVTIEADDGSDGIIMTYELEFTSANSGTMITQQADGNQFQISGLLPQTTYIVRAKVTDNAGSTVSKDKEFTTLIHNHKWDDKWSGNEKHHWHECISSDGMSCAAIDVSKADGYGEHRRGEVQNHKEPTETESGYTGDVYCIDCKRLLEAGMIIDMVVSVTGINIVGNSDTLRTGAGIQLRYDIIPQNATNKEVVWKSSNEEVATVNSNGFVTAHGQGEAIITVTTEDGNLSDTYSVAVDNPPIIRSITVSGLTDKTATVTIEAEDGRDGNIAAYELEFISLPEGATISQNANDNQFQISGLAPQTTYTINVKVTDNTGSSVSREIEITTLIHQHIWNSEWESNETYHWHKCISTDGMSCEADNIEKANGYGEHRGGEIKNYREPTVEEPGYSGDIYCTDCNQLMVKGAEIPTVEHPGEGSEEKPGEGNEEQSGEGNEEQSGEGNEEQSGEGNEEKPGEGSEEKPGEEKADMGDILPEDMPVDGKIPQGIWVAGIEDKYYNGKKHVQKFRVYDGNKLLREKTDYTVAQKNNKNVYTFSEHSHEQFIKQYQATGKAVQTGEINPKKVPQVVLNMKGNYTGKQIICYEILPLDIGDENEVYCADNVVMSWNPKLRMPTPILYWNSTKLKAGRDFSFVSGSGKYMAPGEYKIEVTGKGNFTGYREIFLTVIQDSNLVSMDKVTVKGLMPVLWTAGSNIPQIQVMYEKQILREGVDFTVSSRYNTKVGKAALVLKGMGDYSINSSKFVGEKIVFYDIKGSSMSNTTVSIVESKLVYNGNEVRPEFYVRDSKSGDILKEGSDYIVEYSNNVNKGKATAILTALPESGFMGSKKVTFTIWPGEIKVTGENSFKVFLEGSDELLNKDSRLEFEYMKNGVKPKFTILSPDNKLLIEGKDYMLSHDNNNELTAITGNNAAVVIKGKGNYSGQTRLEYHIIPKDVSDNSTVTLYAADKVFNDKKNGWKQTFKVLDENNAALSKKDYDASSAVYMVYSLPEGETSLMVGDIITNPNTIVPPGSVIQVSVPLKGAYYKGIVRGYYRILKEGYDIGKASFKINKQSYTGSEIYITSQESFTAAGMKLKGAGSTIPLEFGKDFQVVEDSYVKNVLKGTARVTLRGVGEYGGRKTVTFKITGKSILDYWMGVFVEKPLGTVDN